MNEVSSEGGMHQQSQANASVSCGCGRKVDVVQQETSYCIVSCNEQQLATQFQDISGLACMLKLLLS
jgi:hypothetical protein